MSDREWICNSECSGFVRDSGGYCRFGHPISIFGQPSCTKEDIPDKIFHVWYEALGKPKRQNWPIQGDQP